MIQNKKAQTTHPSVTTLMLIIFISISLVIIISLLFKGGEVLWGISERDMCKWEILNSGTSNMISGGFFVTNPACKMKNDTIEMRELKKGKKEAKKTIKEYRRIYKDPVSFDEDNRKTFYTFFTNSKYVEFDFISLSSKPCAGLVALKSAR